MSATCAFGQLEENDFIQEFEYRFTEKLRTNIDNIILTGIKDTCGVIDFYYSIQLSDGDGALFFRLENDCSPVIDFSKLLPQGNYLEVIVSEKYEVLIDSKECTKEEISKAVSDYLMSKATENEDTVVMLRVNRDCKNTAEINTILDLVHSGAVKDNKNFPLIFDLGKSSRAEPPRMNIHIEEDH